MLFQWWLMAEQSQMKRWGILPPLPCFRPLPQYVLRGHQGLRDLQQQWTPCAESKCQVTCSEFSSHQHLMFPAAWLDIELLRCEKNPTIKHKLKAECLMCIPSELRRRKAKSNLDALVVLGKSGQCSGLDFVFPAWHTYQGPLATRTGSGQQCILRRYDGAVPDFFQATSGISGRAIHLHYTGLNKKVLSNEMLCRFVGLVMRSEVQTQLPGVTPFWRIYVIMMPHTAGICWQSINGAWKLWGHEVITWVCTAQMNWYTSTTDLTLTWHRFCPFSNAIVCSYDSRFNEPVVQRNLHMALSTAVDCKR